MALFQILRTWWCRLREFLQLMQPAGTPGLASPGARDSGPGDPFCYFGAPRKPRTLALSAAALEPEREMVL